MKVFAFLMIVISGSFTLADVSSSFPRVEQGPVVQKVGTLEYKVSNDGTTVIYFLVGADRKKIQLDFDWYYYSQPGAPLFVEGDHLRLTGVFKRDISPTGDLTIVLAVTNVEVMTSSKPL